MEQVGFYKASTVAKKFDVSVTTVWRWSKSGVIPPPIKISENISRWDAEEIDEFARELKSSQTVEA